MILVLIRLFDTIFKMIISDPYSRYTRPKDDSGFNQIVNYSPIHLSTRYIMYIGKIYNLFH